MSEQPPKIEIDASTAALLNLIGEDYQSEYRTLIDKLGGCVMQLLFSPKDIHGETAFKASEVKECLRLIKEGQIKILLHPYQQRTATMNIKFLMVAGVDRMPKLLVENALLQNETYDLQVIGDQIIIKNR